jgi:plasmid maintenance system antidote protein VapI
MTRPPTTPGEILRDEYLTPLEMSQRELADHIDQDVKVLAAEPERWEIVAQLAEDLAARRARGVDRRDEPGARTLATRRGAR